MFDSEEILLRLGVDAKAVSGGLARVSAFGRSWARSFVDEINGTFGRLLAAGAAFEFFNKLESRVNSIHRAMQLTGQSAEFIQSAFQKAAMEGIDPDALLRPLSVLTGMTSNGSKFLEDLADKYKHLNTQEERNALLMSLGIKNWQTLIPLLKDGREGIQAMNHPGSIESNFMMSSASVQALHEVVGGGKLAWNYTLGLAGEVAGIVANAGRNIAQPVAAFIRSGIMGKGSFMENLNAIKKKSDEDFKRSQYDAMEAQAEGMGFRLEEQRLELTKARVKAEENILELTNKINDRTKFGNDELADRASELMGTSHLARGLNSVRTLTPAMMAALRVRTLEDQSKIATAYGNAGMATHLQSEADRVRSINPALKYTERYPLEKTQFQISEIRDAIDVISKKISAIPTPP